MKGAIAVNLRSAMEAYKAFVVGVEALLALAMKSDTIEYEKTRLKALKEVETLIDAFVNGQSVNVIGRVVELATKQLSLDLNVVIEQNESLEALQSASGEMMHLRKSLKYVVDGVRRESNSALRRAATARYSTGKVELPSPKINSFVVDSVGRRLSGDSFVEMNFKKYMIDAYVNAYTTLASARGFDIIEVFYDDHAHRNHGLKLSIAGKKGAIPLFEKRRDVFHPNTSANLKVVAHVI